MLQHLKPTHLFTGPMLFTKKTQTPQSV